ncbi:uncharacterized protein SPPG_04932 [Spizellomyces punctatus DAOM BR117]|uniref:C2H2-type domain-containing protein n=1 Tax=Spizellomyces punctatus (strain DAOM BR117) TaxID=645134 RepID=A0A0L0HFH8_SPIPD|nr:hypothetical protein, variant [Spizellomyces punctatus DAOM BR117]XP_016607583.1 uncharacterized protein SPPG_04932 [Spizellomyces punctatus DAOM BR117]KNC99542.1 hypothetical protein, variant [Spizellomyces punctatus DAOM BR117]KNC99543.1 hypothetical protein SPPG_04932 [Spizellomyces punctatus DAOM BR117]|eukprot:XP_016607582.1 hypothetical protein, variant [Spizellomyces punctatus DAOM BR117]
MADTSTHTTTSSSIEDAVSAQDIQRLSESQQPPSLSPSQPTAESLSTQSAPSLASPGSTSVPAAPTTPGQGNGMGLPPLFDNMNSALFMRAAQAIQGLAAQAFTSQPSGNTTPHIPVPHPPLTSPAPQVDTNAATIDKGKETPRHEGAPSSESSPTANPLTSVHDEATRMLLAPFANNPAAAANSLLLLSSTAAAANGGKPPENAPAPPNGAAAAAQLAALYPQLAAAAALDPFAAVMARAHLALAGAAGFPHFPYPLPTQLLHDAAMAAAAAASDAAKHNENNNLHSPNSPNHGSNQSDPAMAALQNVTPGKDGKFICEMCDRSFSRMYNLKSHIRTHQNHRPYICNTCDLRFTRNHDLNRHLKTHSKEKPHICDCCGRKFARRDALRRHERMDAEGKKVHCVVSGGSQDSQANAAAHAAAVAQMLQNGPVQEALHAALVAAQGGGSSGQSPSAQAQVQAAAQAAIAAAQAQAHAQAQAQMVHAAGSSANRS